MADHPDRDVDRFRALFEANFRAILGYALRRTTPELAADVAAETFTVAWRRLADVPAGPEARLWLYGVARRVLGNAHRAQRRHELLTARLAGIAAQQLSRGGPALDPLAQRVREALARLPERDREVLVLTTWEELAPQEIATLLDLPPATVRTRLHRARARLREQLADRPEQLTIRPEELAIRPEELAVRPEPASLAPVSLRLAGTPEPVQEARR